MNQLITENPICLYLATSQKLGRNNKIGRMVTVHFFKIFIFSAITVTFCPTAKKVLLSVVRCPKAVLHFKPKILKEDPQY